MTLENLSWLSSFVSKLPPLPNHRKSFIEIAGYPSWENVNSNLLAFYFDEQEEHNFGRLFFDSLLEIITEKLSESSISLDLAAYDSSFKAVREFGVEEQRRIDILISSNGSLDSENELEEDEEEETEMIKDSETWAIIIENQINATLYNDLTHYWRCVDAEKKIGIVLSPKKLTASSLPISNNCFYINITHWEFIEMVQKNLPAYFLDSDDRHLLMLKEYISHVRFFTPNPQNEIRMNEILKLYQANASDIKRLKEVERNLHNHIYNSWKESMHSFGFKPSSNRITGRKHFYPDEKNPNLSTYLNDNHSIAAKFRFFIHLSSFRNSGKINIPFELHGKKNSAYGSKLKQRLIESGIINYPLSIGDGGGDHSVYNHILYLEVIPDLNSGLSLKEQISGTLRTHLFHEEKNIIEIIVEELKEIIEEAKYEGVIG